MILVAQTQITGRGLHDPGRARGRRGSGRKGWHDWKMGRLALIG